MGRPINYKKLGGELSDEGLQLQFQAYFNAEDGLITARLVKQVAEDRYLLASSSDDTEQMICTLTNSTPNAIGECTLRIKPYAAGSTATAYFTMEIDTVEIETAGEPTNADGTIVGTVVGGTRSVAATISTTVSGNEVTALGSITNRGTYTVLPANPVTLSGYTGTVMPTVNITWRVKAVVISSGGSLYDNIPVATVVTEEVDPPILGTVTLTTKAVSAIAVSDAGGGMTTVPTISINPPEGTIEFVNKLMGHRLLTFSGNAYKYYISDDYTDLVAGECRIYTAA